MKERPDVGVYLREAAPLIRVVKRLMVADSRLLNPEEALPRRDRVTVYLSNHGPFYAPFPAPVLTAEHLLQLGGYDDLIAVTLFHWIVELNPPLKRTLVRHFGHSTRELRSVAGIVELMRERRFHIIGTAPEGSSCAWVYDEPVGPFTRCGLIVAALTAGADIVLAAQKGVEVFGWRARFPGGLTLPLFGGPRGVQVAALPTRRADVTIKYLRYTPEVSPEEVQAAGGRARRALLEQEVERIRAALNRLYRSIP